MCRQDLDDQLKEKYIVNQCRIVYNAWIAMNGNPNEFPNPHQSCCGRLGIECDHQGQITKLRWQFKRLSGNLSPELGSLPRLRRLYVI